MSEKPIIFSGEMVRAILEGRKTQTRRVIKPQPRIEIEYGDFGSVLSESWTWDHAGFNRQEERTPGQTDPTQFCPYGKPGDRLWVRETFSYVTLAENEFDANYSLHKRTPEGYPVSMFYKAAYGDESFPANWIPSIHMPRWASRITLEVVDVRVERVKDISYDDIVAEGWDVKTSQPFTDGTAGQDARTWFRNLWDSINAKRGYGWDVNPWVWVIEFKRQ